MKRCTKTMSGAHAWVKTKIKKLAWANNPFMEVIMCNYCGLIDDRPTQGKKEGKV